MEIKSHTVGSDASADVQCMTKSAHSGERWPLVYATEPGGNNLLLPVDGNAPESLCIKCHSHCELENLWVDTQPFPT